MRYGQISCEAIESERHTADVLAMVVDTSCRIAGLHLLSYNIKPGTHQHLPPGDHSVYCIVRYHDYLMISIYAGREWVQFCLVDESMVQYTTVYSCMVGFRISKSFVHSWVRVVDAKKTSGHHNQT